MKTSTHRGQSKVGLALTLSLIMALFGCQSESLDIRAPYQIRLQVVSPAPNEILAVGQTYTLRLDLLTDSYYSQYGYQFQFFQQTGLGRVAKVITADKTQPVLQKVPVALPLGRSDWHYTPESAGPCQIVLIAQQERGYTQPDTVRLNFKIIP